MVLTKNLLFLLLVGLPTWAAAQRTTIDESVILAYMKTHNIPGLSVAIAINGEITYAEGFGVKNTAQEPVTQGTIFQAASISKSLTSVLILRLVQEGKINLDAPVNTYLKGWQLEADKEASIPSVAQLLNHTGGTNVHGFLGYRHSRKGLPDLTSILNGSRHTHLWEPKIQVKDPPNTTFSYSGGGYCVLQKAILDTEAGSFQAQMQRQIFGPCGMKSSFFSTALTPQEEQRIAFGYKDNGKPLRAEYHVYPQMAAAGLWTTPSDLVGFLTHIQQS
ncbi:MAG TPA: hypothetical protein DCP28_06610, partial [Cytophagales bacterium]|nr:hypothetical protein [Cytophagales bacterium]